MLLIRLNALLFPIMKNGQRLLNLSLKRRSGNSAHTCLKIKLTALGGRKGFTLEADALHAATKCKCRGITACR